MKLMLLVLLVDLLVWGRTNNVLRVFERRDEGKRVGVVGRRIVWTGRKVLDGRKEGDRRIERVEWILS